MTSVLIRLIVLDMTTQCRISCPKPMFFPLCERPTYSNKWNYSSAYFSLHALYNKEEDERSWM